MFFQAFAKVFQATPDDLDMHVIYDVSHNIAKVEEHVSCYTFIPFCSNMDWVGMCLCPDIILAAPIFLKRWSPRHAEP